MSSTAAATAASSDTPAGAAATGCFQLTGSTACPDLSGMYVAPLRNGFNDVATFDKYIVSNTKPSPDYISTFRSAFSCPAFDGTGQRYATSVQCFFFVAKSGCAENPNPLPASDTLCQAPCQQNVAANRAILSNTTLCTSNPAAAAGTNRKDLTAIESFCSTLPTTSKCSKGLRAEFATCGFATPLEAQRYCSTQTGKADPCCIMVASTAAMSAGDPGSLVDPISATPYIASGLALGGMLLGATLFFFYVKVRRWRSVTTTAIQPGENEIKPGTTLGRTGTVVRGRMDAEDGPSSSRGRFMNTVRKSFLGPARSTTISPAAPGSGPKQQSLNRPPLQSLNRQPPMSMYSDFNPSSSNNNGTYQRNSPTPPMPAIPPRVRNAPPEFSLPVLPTQPAMMETFENRAPSILPLAQTMTVVQTYEAQMGDELTLNIGDVVSVDEEFDDGWAVGTNHTTSTIGAFPLSCLEPASPQPYPGDNSDEMDPSVRASEFFSAYARRSMRDGSGVVRERGVSLVGMPRGR
ncbi:uncharacterized protein EV422DRAFT_542232 [Fimicolochytrium jonesii]|uniref:uncharacterized protein n=1 Tax=Fimicolochytrium jonesii TaxID=1396493 RepID=UPI0022FEAD75|nr:uncharacterized protein EV422DRAFT_542232 [Fimicolochytrium jonesii]KAI8817276.1 hypothetical protein EV422DRAFT_542232 [Fimicolochytrium jonesii]